MTLQEKINAVYSEYYKALGMVRSESAEDRSEQELKLWNEAEEKLAAVWVSHGRILH